MSEENDITDHINNLNKCISQLLSVEVKIEKENKAIILLVSLPKSYKTW